MTKPDYKSMTPEQAEENEVSYLAEIAQLTERVAELEAAQQWQPIETAPKDGTSVLIYCNDMAVEAWYWPLAWHETMYGTEYDGDLWVCFDDKFQSAPDDVTHWMPLPQPPASDESEVTND